MKRLRHIRVPRPVSVAGVLIFAGLWLLLFLSDAGNFWHGGSVMGAVATDAAAVCGSFAFMEVLRSDAPKSLKFSLAIPAVPLLLFTGFALIYAAHRALAV